MPSYPEPLDDDGTINVHAEAGLAGIPIRLRENGRVIDISATPIWFEVSAVSFAKLLAAHPTVATDRQLSLTAAEAAAIPDGARWVLLDKTAPATPVELMFGRVRKYQ